MEPSTPFNPSNITYIDVQGKRNDLEGKNHVLKETIYDTSPIPGDEGWWVPRVTDNTIISATSNIAMEIKPNVSTTNFVINPEVIEHIRKTTKNLSKSQKQKVYRLRGIRFHLRFPGFIEQEKILDVFKFYQQGKDWKILSYKTRWENPHNEDDGQEWTEKLKKNRR